MEISLFSVQRYEISGNCHQLINIFVSFNRTVGMIRNNPALSRDKAGLFRHKGGLFLRGTRTLTVVDVAQHLRQLFVPTAKTIGHHHFREVHVHTLATLLSKHLYIFIEPSRCAVCGREKEGYIWTRRAVLLIPPLIGLIPLLKLPVRFFIVNSEIPTDCFCQ